MEPRNQSPSTQPKKIDPENVKLIDWEDFEEELARLWSLSSALKEAQEKKQTLQQRLDSVVQVGFVLDLW
ncbi:hypothetical protein SLEP1_g44151 [Rubroshorea leprosula]|uniref:Uncharacterized protein n=1 Tax=Rubroshorea leprosula TaxID=152421 RepID=A0AAV5LFA3_9ROSI|nr:hypothetical protein SLEP1_g44151 [Rubroshorea leprosula]